MFKKIIRPFQNVLLERKLCVGCTSPLTKAKKIGVLSETRTLVECKCKRRYVYEKELAGFKRATLAEEQQVISQIAKGSSW